MYAVGVDVSKGKSTVAVLRSKSKVVMRPIDVAHNAQGFAGLAERLHSLDGEIKVVMEHTGNYYESIAMFLHSAGFAVSAVNPLLIKEYGGNSLRKVKTDKADSIKIARYALDNWEELRQYSIDRVERKRNLSVVEDVLNPSPATHILPAIHAFFLALAAVSKVSQIPSVLIGIHDHNHF